MALENEINQRKFRSEYQKARINLIYTYNWMMESVNAIFDKWDVTPRQFNILRILRGEGKPLPILEIASRTITIVPGITGLIDRLERAGFVHRLRCEKDRRVIYVALTDQGTKTLADLDEPLLALHRKLMGHLSQGDLKDLTRLLEKLREPWTASDG